MIWWMLVPDRAKTHYVPDSLHDALVSNLRDRGHPASSNSKLHKVVDTGGIDTGGSIMVDVQNWMEFDIEGLEFSFRASEIEIFLIQLRDLKERLELGTVYYKLHGAYQCLCLLPAMRDRLITDMSARLGEANAIRDIENREWNKRLEKLSRSSFVELHKRPVKEKT